MTGLEQAFYIMAIVYMAIMFVLMIAVVIAVFVIKAKIHQIQRQLEEKLAFITTTMQLGSKVAGIVKETAKKVMHSKA
jgi:cell division protein FtsL